MMNNIQLDPYEQQLLTVFNRYDYENLGTLDHQGLTELCHTLQLQEHGTELVNHLLRDSRKSRVNFIEFRDALLTLLKEIQNLQDSEETKENQQPDKKSPEREVSPKYIYGSKKYGRRSRPKIENRGDEQDNDSNLSNNKDVSVQRSHSEITNSKKRKTYFKLKRCTSLPSDQNPLNSFDTSFMEESDFVCNEDMLRKAWKSLGVGENGYLNQQELILVCDAIGLHNLANGVLRQLSEKIDLEHDHKISFQELLEVLQEDETWSDMLNSTVPDSCSETLISDKAVFPDSQSFQYISLGPDGSGSVNIENVIDMWETVGITAPKELLHELGFNGPQINVTELAIMLDSSLKSIQESESNGFINPHLSLLQANLTLYQSEIRCLKNILEQLNAERDKLKLNVTEANKRATLLALEVDDNHQKMQESTQKQVRILEQRHSEILKDITKQFTDEKEELTNLNSVLEERISGLEQEVIKLRTDLDNAKKYLSSVEVENHHLNTTVSDLHQVKEVLEEQVVLLETECQKYSELEHEKIKPLLEKLSRLEIENNQLRDQSDEMGAEIESLNKQVSLMKSKVPSNLTLHNLNESMENSFLMQCEAEESGSLASKRRINESPSKDLTLYHSNLSSPRLGKVRKIPKNSEDRLTSSESGFSTEIECSESSFCSSSNDSQDIKRLQAKIIFLEQILRQHDIPLPLEDETETTWPNIRDVIELKKRINGLEKIINDIKKDFSKVTTKDNNIRIMLDKLNKMLLEEELLGGRSYEKHEIQTTKTYRDASTETEIVDNLEEKVQTLEKQNKDLTEKCESLENCIELLKNEYEKCEDYWANKLDEERQIYEKEQAQSSEKLDEIMIKMAEYEEQFQQTAGDRLPPIAETYNLEQQFNDLEEEYDNYKNNAQSLIESQNIEINLLKEKLTELAMSKSNSCSVEVQVDILNEYTFIANKMMNLSKHVVESTNVFSTDSHRTDYTSESACEEKRLNPIVGTDDEISNGSTQNEKNIYSNGASTSSGSDINPGVPCRPTRTRKRHRDDNLYKKQGNFRTPQWENEKMIYVPVSMLEQRDLKRIQLEQKCKHLQLMVKQQQYFAEKTLQHCWQNQQAEKAELQCLLKHTQERLEQQVRTCRELSEKLTKNDILVKDLYVENCYLSANTQRLEQQRNMLAHCRSTNNSL